WQADSPNSRRPRATRHDSLAPARPVLARPHRQHALEMSSRSLIIRFLLALVGLVVACDQRSKPAGKSSSSNEPADAPPTSLYIENLTWPEVQRAIAKGKNTAIIYIGSTEQNGPHMAIGKHNFIAHYVAGE